MATLFTIYIDKSKLKVRKPHAPTTRRIPDKKKAKARDACRAWRRRTCTQD